MELEIFILIFLIVTWGYQFASNKIMNLENENEQLKYDLEINQSNFLNYSTNDECNIPHKIISENKEYIIIKNCKVKK